MINTIKKIIYISANHFKLNYAILLFLTITSAILECLSVIWISPLIAGLSNETISSEVVFVFLNIIIISGIIKILFIYAQNKTAFNSGVLLNKLLLNKLLFTPVHELEKKQKSESVAQIQLKCQNIIYGILLPFFSIVSNLFIASFIFAYLLLFDWASTLILFTAIITILASTLIIIKNKLKTSSTIIAKSYDSISEMLLATLSNIREIRIYQKENHFLNVINLHEKNLRNAQSISSFFSVLPRSILETSGLAALVLLAATSTDKDNFSQGLALLATMGFAAQKLLPSAQQIYNNVTTLFSNFASAKDVLEEIMSSRSASYDYREIQGLGNIDVKSISVSDLSCTYDRKMMFKPISFSMKVGEITTFIGPSGVGKSTLLLTLSGLLKPFCGSIKVSTSDDVDEILPQMVSYASQSAVLENQNVYQNISLSKDGYDEKYIDEILKGLGLFDELINLDDGLSTLLGESGNLLSGGQKQRVIIARALYFNRPILILDEVTSNLNQELEINILEYIKKTSDKKIILTSAHRPKAIEISDQIIKLEK